MKKTSQQEFLDSLNNEQKLLLLKHFDTIYECKEVGEHEYKISYLAYLWKNGYVYSDPENEGAFNILKEETGVDEWDYELSIEVDAEDTGGVNLNITYDYYNIGDLMKIL